MLVLIRLWSQLLGCARCNFLLLSPKLLLKLCICVAYIARQPSKAARCWFGRQGCQHRMTRDLPEVCLDITPCSGTGGRAGPVCLCALRNAKFNKVVIIWASGYASVSSCHKSPPALLSGLSRCACRVDALSSSHPLRQVYYGLCADLSACDALWSTAVSSCSSVATTKQVSVSRSSP